VWTYHFVSARTHNAYVNIHDAATLGDLQRVKALVAEHPDLVSSTANTFGNTPLMYAAIYGHKDIARFLLANKADVNARNRDSKTALHWAAGKAIWTWWHCCS
jgi:ankyrin repeat protein